MTYQEALDHLNSLGESRIRPGLARITEALSILGEPHKEFPHVLVGGTNGKGSVIAMMGAVLGEAGYRVGRFTSPHLFRFEERINVGGSELLRHQLPELVSEVRDTGVSLTYFELAAACAILHFSREKVDLGLLEVGLGGRWDAVNAADPVLSVITNIHYDHMEWLGPTLGEIAREKACIMRRGRPAVLGAMSPDAVSVISREARDIGTVPYLYGSDYTISVQGSGFSYRGRSWKIDNLKLALEGRFQEKNAACSLAALESLGELGFSIPSAAVEKGLSRVRWPGRFQRIGGSPEIIVDSAHNPDALRALIGALSSPAGPRVWVFSALGDKDIQGMVQQVAGKADVFVVVPIPHPRAADPERIREAFLKSGKNVLMAETVSQGISLAVKEAGQKGKVVVAGSVYLAAAALAELGIGPGEGDVS